MTGKPPTLLAWTWFWAGWGGGPTETKSWGQVRGKSFLSETRSPMPEPQCFFLLIYCPHVFLHRFYVFCFFNLFIFNGRIIALQYWVGFCHTSTWISHRYTYVRSLLSLPPSPSHPSRLLHSPGFTLWKTNSKWEFAVDSILMAAWLISVVQTQLPRSCPQKRLQAGLQSSCSV